MTKKKKIAVTGASGYIASWIVKKLIEEGYTVHGTVRSLDNTEKIAPLQAIQGEGTLELFEADLLKEGDFDNAFQDCDIVIHTASPFFMGDTKTPQKDFIEPAVKGTENVLQSASNIATIKKVVLTSSIAAMYNSNAEIPSEDGILREDCWNNYGNLKNEAYRISKTLAEIRAWEIAEAQKKWHLIVINPGAVLGPSLTDATISGSVDMMKKICEGEFAKGVPNISIGLVDVRTVAEAHINAAFLESPAIVNTNAHARARYILVDEVLSILDITNIIKTKYAEHLPLPSKNLPKALVYLLAKKIGFNKRFVIKNVGVPIAIDNTKSTKDLDIHYGVIENAILEHIAQIMNIPIPVFEENADEHTIEKADENQNADENTSADENSNDNENSDEHISENQNANENTSADENANDNENSDEHISENTDKNKSTDKSENF